MQSNSSVNRSVKGCKCEVEKTRGPTEMKRGNIKSDQQRCWSNGKRRKWDERGKDLCVFGREGSNEEDWLCYLRGKEKEEDREIENLLKSNTVSKTIDVGTKAARRRNKEEQFKKLHTKTFLDRKGKESSARIRKSDLINSEGI